MKSLTVTLAVVGLVAISSADSLRDQINASNKKIGKCMEKKDMDGFAKACKAGMTKDFKYMEGGQTMTFDQMFAQMKASFQQLTTVSSATSSIVKLTQKGDSATCLTKHVMKGTMMGPDKKKHTFEMGGTSTDVYKKVGKEWKMASMSWVNGDMKMDGKKMDPSKMGG